MLTITKLLQPVLIEQATNEFNIGHFFITSQGNIAIAVGHLDFLIKALNLLKKCFNFPFNFRLSNPTLTNFSVQAKFIGLTPFRMLLQLLLHELNDDELYDFKRHFSLHTVSAFLPIIY